jgi:hypothetical protein
VGEETFPPQLIADGNLKRCSVCGYPFPADVHPSMSVAFAEHLLKAHKPGQTSEDASVATVPIVREATEREGGKSGGIGEESVFLLWYVKERDGAGADLLIGVYRTEPDAEAAIDRLKSKAGFVDAPKGFRINRYELNRDHWEDGYVADTGDG